MCAITTGMKKHKLIIKKKRKSHDKIVLLGKAKLDNMEVLISKALFDTNISHCKTTSVNNVLREYNDMKKEIKSLQNSMEYIIQIQWKRVVSVIRKILRAKIQVSEEQNKTDLCFFQIVMFVVRKSKYSLKIKKSIE